jgi:hypothetical protein
MSARATRLLAATVGMIVIMRGVAPAQEEPWHTMTGPDKSFTAELPAAPKYTATKLKAPGTGSIYTMHQYLVESSERAFIVQSIVYPKDLVLPDAQKTLQNGLDNTGKKMEGGKWASVDWVKHQGLPAVDTVGVRDGQEVRSFLVMRGRQVFTLIYAGPPATARSGDAARFFASLHIAQ